MREREGKKVRKIKRASERDKRERERERKKERERERETCRPSRLQNDNRLYYKEICVRR